jgi:hypothetical protein
VHRPPHASGDRGWSAAQLEGLVEGAGPFAGGVGVTTQASRIFAKFGGVPALHRALDAAGFTYDISSLYRWALPREKGGSAGVIPTAAQTCVAKAARREGILLTAEDWNPEAV